MLLSAGCASQNAAEREIYRLADAIVHETETSPSFIHSQLGTAGVNRVIAGVRQHEGEVLGSRVIVPGLGEPDVLRGWIEATFTVETEGGWTNSLVTATLCLRFEIRWDDMFGGSVTFHEFDCP